MAEVYGPRPKQEPRMCAVKFFQDTEYKTMAVGVIKSEYNVFDPLTDRLHREYNRVLRFLVCVTLSQRYCEEH